MNYQVFFKEKQKDPKNIIKKKKKRKINKKQKKMDEDKID